jgi:hypothetical protein
MLDSGVPKHQKGNKDILKSQDTKTSLNDENIKREIVDKTLEKSHIEYSGFAFDCQPKQAIAEPRQNPLVSNSVS